jgi:hypothetical protein
MAVPSSSDSASRLVSSLGTYSRTARREIRLASERVPGRLLLMGSITWGSEIAEVYDETYAALFEPSVLGPMVAAFEKLR